MKFASIDNEAGPIDHAAVGRATDLAKARYEEFMVTPVRRDGPPSRAAVEAACAKIVASRAFGRSLRHRAFLNHVVRTTLDGLGLRLSEKALGLDLFGRSMNTYDPRRDSIVRVEARRLRDKLARYYADEGRGDEIGICLPVGSYVPRFEWRQPVPPADVGTPLFAVMRFIVSREAPELRALSVTIADQLVHLIGLRTDLRVVAPMVAARLRDQAVSFDALRRLHDVAYVVDGSIVGDGSRLRCIAHLFRTRDQQRLWSERFDFDASGSDPVVDADPFAFQDRIAVSVAAAAAALLEH